MVAHIAATLLTAFMVYTAVPGSSLFSWHPTLMTVAFVLLMFEAILVFSGQSSMILSQTRAYKAEVHAWVMGVAAICASCGFAAIYINKDMNHKNHFTSWHGFMGVLTLSYVLLQMIGGILLKYSGILRWLNIQIRLVDLKLYHATSGLVLFTAISATLILAFWSDWFISQTNVYTWYACFMALSCMSMIVMQQITTTYLPQTRRPGVAFNNTQTRKQKKQK
ncbi:cytochrome b561 domain-containing protein 2-like [Mizuhopecten yessoensis]|uniref:ascorbate ferrireductase (transmembrane) n=1 Tax=Mizuhopecten yessoensis TaxID=6573 RepID=A0A210R359_MIZYE|nr:cytochrome b561 domain-containing protein 2-like [Mizuhopecten yessoensis]OWF55449.1 Cytochrome b561 domain-containing protein 1 [Mizuhopecten yessoensis]